MTFLQRLALLIIVVATTLCAGQLQWKLRQRKFDRGRKLTAVRRIGKRGGLQWGSQRIPESDATQHFLSVGTTGSGKSLVQRMLMQGVLPQLRPGSDRRAVILDAKNDMPAYLRQIGVTCPVYSLNPFESRASFPAAVGWDVAADITCPARALNFAGALIPSQRGDNNRYFTDAARLVVAGMTESFIRHSPGDWSFADLVHATMSMNRIREVLSRDSAGSEVLSGFLGDERTGYQVFTTIASRMAYFKPVAALWQRNQRMLSLRSFLSDESILLLGSDSTTKIALDAVNEIVFRILVEEIDSLSDSADRRIWVWVDEARLSGPLLRGEMLPYLAVKGRSKGACLVLSFQDMEGFREAAGPRIANEIVAQCSHKALLRLESEESAAWASRLIGQYEAIEMVHSRPTLTGRGGSRTEQLRKQETVLPSEFYTIPPTSRDHGLTGYFLSPSFGAVRDQIPSRVLQTAFVSTEIQNQMRFRSHPEGAQRLVVWSASDRQRLSLADPQIGNRQRKDGPQPGHNLPMDHDETLTGKPTKSRRRLDGVHLQEPPKNGSRASENDSDKGAYLSCKSAGRQLSDRR